MDTYSPAAIPETLKPGWQTTEFWTAIASKLISLLIFGGVVTTTKGQEIQTQISIAVAGVFAIISLMVTAKAYIGSRTAAKASWHQMVSRVGVMVLALLLLPGLATAQTKPACLLPWRASVEQRLQQQKQAPQADPAVMSTLTQILSQQGQILALLTHQQASPGPAAPVMPAQPPAAQTAPTQPPVIIHQYMTPPSSGAPPLQSFPIAGQPLQSFPIAGQPLQSFPIAGTPLQQFPIQGQPQQSFPISGQPLQQFPLATPGGGQAPQQLFPVIPSQPPLATPTPAPPSTPPAPTPGGRPLPIFPIGPPSSPTAPSVPVSPVPSLPAAPQAFPVAPPATGAPQQDFPTAPNSGKPSGYQRYGSEVTHALWRPANPQR